MSETDDKRIAYLQQLAALLADLDARADDWSVNVKGLSVSAPRAIGLAAAAVSVRVGYKDTRRYTKTDVGHVALQLRRILQEQAARKAERAATHQRWQEQAERETAAAAEVHAAVARINPEVGIQTVSGLDVTEWTKETGERGYVVDFGLHGLSIEQARAVLAIVEAGRAQLQAQGGAA